MTGLPGFSLSLTEYEAVWRHLGLGAQPYPLVIPTGPPSREDQLRVQQEVLRGLTGRGLLRAGVLDAELEELLQLIGTHSVSVHAFAGAVRAIAAGDGYSGVLAVLTDQGISLRPIRASELADAITEVLPPGLVGTTGIAADRYEQLVVLVACSIRSGSFGATSACPTDELVWFDLPAGRYLATRDGDRPLVTPASDELIVEHVRGMLGEKRPASVEQPTPPVGLATR